jgi:uncharacterized protein
MHYLLMYRTAPEYMERRGGFRREHLAHAWEAQARGELVLAGAFAEPPDGAVFVFDVDDPETVEAFARADPYVRNGLISEWRVRRWTTVVGDHASTPIRSEDL